MRSSAQCAIHNQDKMSFPIINGAILRPLAHKTSCMELRREARAKWSQSRAGDRSASKNSSAGSERLAETAGTATRGITVGRSGPESRSRAQRSGKGSWDRTRRRYNRVVAYLGNCRVRYPLSALGNSPRKLFSLSISPSAAVAHDGGGHAR
jgi:hypothetical protein